MGFIENFKIKRAAKKAKAVYEAELNEWERENSVLNAALDIFTSASKGEEPNDLSLAQKKGELILWTGNAIYHEAGRTVSLTFSLLRKNFIAFSTTLKSFCKSASSA